MSRKTLAEWKILVDKQVASGLSVPEFCQQQHLNPKYFYSRKALICQSNVNVGFVQAQVVTEQTSRIAIAHQAPIKLKTPVAKLLLPNDISPQFIIKILQGLTSCAYSPLSNN